MRNIERKREIIAQLKPIDDVMTEKIFEDMEVCQEILTTILQEEELEIVEVIPQNSIRNLQGRSVRLDLLCKKKDDSFCTVEVQKSDDDNHLKRVRYNAACITANVTDPGTKFEHVPDVYSIFISRFDIFEAGKTTYHIDNVIRENGEDIDNGQYTVFVNTAVDDGTDIAELMQCFEQTEVNNPKFPKLSNRVRQLKGLEKGESLMTNLWEEYAKEYAEECVRDNVLETAKKLFAMDLSFEQVRNVIDITLVSTETLREIEKNVQETTV